MDSSVDHITPEALSLLIDPMFDFVTMWDPTQESETIQTGKTQPAPKDISLHSPPIRSSSLSSNDDSGNGRIFSSSSSESSYDGSDYSSSSHSKTISSKKKIDKATARKLANRESAKNSYLKKKEYVKNLERENEQLKDEVGRWKKEAERLRMALITLQDKQLFLEDMPLSGGPLTPTVEGGNVLPLYQTTPAALTSGLAAQRKRRRRGVSADAGENDVPPPAAPPFFAAVSSEPSTSTTYAASNRSGRGAISSSSVAKLATLPIVALSSTLCFLDHTSNMEPRRLSGAIQSVGGDVTFNFLVLAGFVALVAAYFLLKLDFDKIAKTRQEEGVKRNVWGKYWVALKRGSGTSNLPSSTKSR